MPVSEFCRRRALELYPQLARAVPPEDCGAPPAQPLRVGKPPHGVANYFWQDHMEAVARRQPNDPTALVGPLTAQGDCLLPLRREGDKMSFDPPLRARAGDIVLFQLASPNAVDELELMAKVLVRFAGEYWLAYNSGMFPLADIRILGVEVDAARAGRRFERTRALPTTSSHANEGGDHNVKKFRVEVITPAGAKLGYVCEAETEEEARRNAAQYVEKLSSRTCARGSSVASALGRPEDAPFYLRSMNSSPADFGGRRGVCRLVAAHQTTVECSRVTITPEKPRRAVQVTRRHRPAYDGVAPRPARSNPASNGARSTGPSILQSGVLNERHYG